LPDNLPETTRRHNVTGPYHYTAHPAFNIGGPRGIVATVFAFDGDEQAAEQRTHMVAAALDRGERGPE
jgi:hypothetical protein